MRSAALQESIQCFSGLSADDFWPMGISGGTSAAAPRINLDASVRERPGIPGNAIAPRSIAAARNETVLLTREITRAGPLGLTRYTLR